MSGFDKLTLCAAPLLPKDSGQTALVIPREAEGDLLGFPEIPEVHAQESPGWRLQGVFQKPGDAAELSGECIYLLIDF